MLLFTSLPIYDDVSNSLDAAVMVDSLLMIALQALTINPVER